MLKHVTLCLAATLFCGSAAAATLPEIDIKAGCKEVSDAVGGSALIESQCRKDEASAKNRLERMEISPRALKSCSELATFSSAGGYQIMEQCVKMEMQAEKDLQ
jgi:hypothetical protein